MGSPARTLRNAALAALGLVVLPASSALGNEVSARVDAQELRIVTPEEVLRDYCTLDGDGTLWFHLPGGASYELVTSTSDPAIANPGDGQFHAFDASFVRDALGQLRYPLQGLRADVFLLPFPRRGALDSGAGPGLILLAPGVMPMSAEHQHAEFVHELGHVVQYQWMPDRDDRWTDYRRQRGIEDGSRYSASSPHAYRPHEIFAEDFRALFGGALATYSGSIENPDLVHPSAVPGLDTFLRTLPEAAALATKLVASANPARGPVSFETGPSASRTLDLFDVLGRRIVSLEAVIGGSRTVWNWGGLDASGRSVPRGVVMARVRGANAPATRLVWMP